MFSPSACCTTSWPTSVLICFPLQRVVQHHGQRVRLRGVQGPAQAGRKAWKRRVKMSGKFCEVKTYYNLVLNQEFFFTIFTKN